jgi:outer membrane protein assembly factor BamB
VAPVSVAGGLIYAAGFRDGLERITAFDGAGGVVWRRAVGPESGERAFMRFAAPRPVTVDDERLYFLTTMGVLLCLDSATGETRWSRDYAADFRGRRISWGWTDAPLVEGELLIVTPGSADAVLAGLDKRSGAEIWRRKELQPNDRVSAAVVAADFAGTRQVVALTYDHLAGVDLETGELLWKAPRAGKTVVVCPPVVVGDVVVAASGYGVGHSAFRIERNDGVFSARELYSGKELTVQQGGVVALGRRIYGANDSGTLFALDAVAGAPAWSMKVGKSALVAADGKLICRTESHRTGDVILVEPRPEGGVERGRFQAPGSELLRTAPVVVGGRLYLRDQDRLACHDLRGPSYRGAPSPWDILSRVPPVPPKAPPASPARALPAYVPTPQDVVEAMLEAAATKSSDAVYDLGSGDGRIVITAAKRYGCSAVGVELDGALAEESRLRVREALMGAKVTILQEDLFKADFSRATVIALYLGEPANERLLPKLRALKPGVRIVSHEHLLGKGGPPPDRTQRMVSSEDGSEHAIHVWTTPLR